MASLIVRLRFFDKNHFRTDNFEPHFNRSNKTIWAVFRDLCIYTVYILQSNAPRRMHLLEYRNYKNRENEQ